jgi:hypothetical protein
MNGNNIANSMIACFSGAFNSMKRRDWLILTGSVAVGNAYWAVACWLGISAVEWLWRVVTGGVW